MLVINFKNYKTGNRGLRLAKAIEQYLPKAIICSSTLDIELITQKTKLQVFSQHVDPQEGEKTTGYNTLKAIKESGAKGTLINHSEHPLSILNIHKILIMSKKLNLKPIVCTQTLGNMKRILKIRKVKPYAIAFEDSKLISTGKSITKYNNKTIINFIKIMKKTKIIPLCGAGITTAKDVKEAYDLGCKGVLIASAIANAKNPSLLLKQLKKFQ